MRIYGKILIVTLVCLLLMGVFATTIMAKERLEVLTFWTGADKVAIEGAVDVFEEKYPDVDVKHSSIEAVSFKTTLTTLLVGGMPPDVISWWDSQRTQLIEKGAIMSLDDFWAENNLDAVFAIGTKEKFCEYNGHVYFIPHVLQMRTCTYNKKIFDKYGVKAPKTWDEFINIMETLKSNGVTPLVVGTKGEVWGISPVIDALIQRTAGPEFMLRLGAGKESWKDPRVVEAFKIFVDWLEKGYINNDMLAIDFNEGRARFGRGEAGMFFRATWVSGGLEENFGWKSGVDYGSFQWPAIKPGIKPATLGYADGWMIPKDAENPDLAKEFIKTMISKKAQIAHTVKGKHGLSMVKAVSPNEYSAFKKSQKETLDKNGVTVIMNTMMKTDFLNKVYTPLIQKLISNPDKLMEILDELEIAK